MDNLLRAHKQGELLGLSEVAGLKPRLDIDVLLFDKPDAFNLFILALSELQDFKNSADKNGYFMLASRFTSHCYDHLTKETLQVSMGFQRTSGTASPMRQNQTSPALMGIALMVQYDFQHGIDHIWHYTRYVLKLAITELL